MGNLGLLRYEYDQLNLIQLKSLFGVGNGPSNAIVKYSIQHPY